MLLGFLGFLDQQVLLHLLLGLILLVFSDRLLDGIKGQKAYVGGDVDSENCQRNPAYYDTIVPH